MKTKIATAALLAVAGRAHAEEIALKPLADLRARYETVEQAELPREAHSLTFRLRGGIEAKEGPLSALVEGQATLAALDRRFDGLRGDGGRPLIGDPQNIALYRAQIQYRGAGVTLTAGRQRSMLDDERFVGAANFRQAGQTFDAARAEIMPVKGLKADISYVWSVRTIWGIDGFGARQQAISGNTILANLSYATPIGTVAGFAYLVDQDEAAVQGFRLSSQTYGLRLAGGRLLPAAVKLSYQLSYARQSDYHRNPNHYAADYYLIDLGLEARGARIGGGYEILGADRGMALTSVQTPLATTFKFQGWADKFLTTPPNGVRDLYGSLGYGWRKAGPFKGLSVQAIYHRFDSDRLSQHYGNEIDLLGSARLGRTTISVRYADYRAKSFATDTRKLWLQLDWSV